jgi:hypothetical protein
MVKSWKQHLAEMPGKSVYIRPKVIGPFPRPYASGSYVHPDMLMNCSLNGRQSRFMLELVQSIRQIAFKSRTVSRLIYMYIIFRFSLGHHGQYMVYSHFIKYCYCLDFLRSISQICIAIFGQGHHNYISKLCLSLSS